MAKVSKAQRIARAINTICVSYLCTKDIPEYPATLSAEQRRTWDAFMQSRRDAFDALRALGIPDVDYTIGRKQAGR